MRIVGRLIHAGLWCIDGVFGALQGLAAIKRRLYQPERHYMRGPGPKSRQKFGAASGF